MCLYCSAEHGGMRESTTPWSIKRASLFSMTTISNRDRFESSFLSCIALKFSLRQTFFITNRVSNEGTAIGRVRPSARLFLLYRLKQLTTVSERNI